MRGRTVPVNPQSDQQVAVRVAVTTLIDRWTETLTQTQRDAWDLYASNVLVTNPLGDAVAISGQNWYVAVNTPRLQAGNALYDPLDDLPLVSPLSEPVDVAPGIFDRGEVGAISLEVLQTGASGVQLAYDDSQAWANEDDAAMLVFLSRPRSAGREFFRGPWRLAAAVLGNNAVPPVSPLTFTAQSPSYTYAVGQRGQVSVAVIRADGRYSSRVVSNSLVVTV